VWWRFLNNLKIDLPHGPSWLLLDIYLKECKSTYTCILMFIAALLTIAKLWNQPRHPQLIIDEKVLYIHNGVLFSHKEE
jgi:hypothetical protein